MRRTVSLPQDRSLIAAFSHARRRVRRWVVLLTESGAGYQTGGRREARLLLGDLADDFNYLVVNKPGLTPGGKRRRAFENSFRRDLRVADTLLALAAIVPAGHKIYLVGYSEGAYLAPEIAAADARVRGTIMIAGGTRGWLREELGKASVRARASLRRRVRSIRAAGADAKKRWNGFSYATWNSYDTDQGLRALRALRTPTLSIFGAQDREIDLKTTLADLAPLKHVDVEVLPDCGHQLTADWREVAPTVRDFLTCFI